MQRFLRSLKPSSQPEDGPDNTDPRPGSVSPTMPLRSPRAVSPRSPMLKSKKMSYKLMRNANKIYLKWGNFSKLETELEREKCFRSVLSAFTALFGAIEVDPSPSQIKVPDALGEYMMFHDILCEKLAASFSEMMTLENESTVAGDRGTFLSEDLVFGEDGDVKQGYTDEEMEQEANRILSTLINEQPDEVRQDAILVEMISAIYYFLKYIPEREEVVLHLVGYGLHRYISRVLYWMSYLPNTVTAGGVEKMELCMMTQFICGITYQDRISFADFVKFKLEILIPFRLACLRSPPRNISVQRNGLALIDKISMGSVAYPRAFEVLVERRVVTHLLKSLNKVFVEEREKPNLEHYTQLWKAMVGLIARSADSTTALQENFEEADGYTVATNCLRVIIQLHSFGSVSIGGNLQETNENPLSEILEALMELGYVGGGKLATHAQRFVFDEQTGELIIDELSEGEMMGGKLMRDNKAFQVLLDLFLDTNQLPVQIDILKTIQFVLEDHPYNYYLLLRMNPLCRMIENIENVDEQVKIKIIDIFKYVAFDLETIPLQEICSFIILLYKDSLIDPFANPLIEDIIDLFSALCRKQRLYKTLLTRNGLLDIIKSIFNHHLENMSQMLIGNLKSLANLEKLWNLTLLLCEGTSSNFKTFDSQLDGMKILFQYIQLPATTKMALDVLHKFLIMDSTPVPKSLATLFEIVVATPIDVRLAILSAMSKLFYALPSAQDDFRGIEGFRYTICLLSSLPDDSIRARSKLQLIEAVLHLFASSVKDNEMNRAELKLHLKMHGISDAIKLCGVLGDENMGEEACTLIFQALHDLALEKPPSTAGFSITTNNSMLIRNPHALLQVLWLIAGDVPVEPAVLVVGRIDSQVQRNIQNIHQLAEIEFCLEILNILGGSDFTVNRNTKRLQSALIRLFEIIASYSLSVCELKKLFSILRRDPDEEPSLIYERLRPLLLKSFCRISNSDHYPLFQFDLRTHTHASLHVPCIYCKEANPAPNKHLYGKSRGYSISLWLYIDAMDPALSLPLYSLRSDDNKVSMDAYILGRKLYIKMLRNAVEFKKFSFQQGKWYHVVISHKLRRLTTSTIGFHIDGILQETRSITFLAATSSHIQFILGNVRALPKKSDNCWRVGAVTFFKEELKHSSIVQLNALGLNHVKLNAADLRHYYTPKTLTYERFLSLSAVSLPHEDILSLLTFQDRNSQLADSIDSGKILFSYAPFKPSAKFLGGDAQNPNKFHNFASLDGLPAAFMNGGMTYMRPNLIRTAIRRIGGISAILDLLMSCEDTASLCYVLDIIDNMSQSPTTEIDMQRVKGYQMMAHCLSTNYILISSEAIECLCRQAGYNGKDFSTSLVSNTRIVQNVILEYDGIWSKTPVNLQQKLFSQLSCFVSEEDDFIGQQQISHSRESMIEFNKARLREIDIVSRILYVVRHEKCPSSVVMILMKMLMNFFVDGRKEELSGLASMISETSFPEFYVQASAESDTARKSLRLVLLNTAIKVIRMVEDEKAIASAFDMKWIYFVFQSGDDKKTSVLAVEILISLLMKGKGMVEDISRDSGYESLSYLLPKFWKYEEVYAMLLSMVMTNEDAISKWKDKKNDKDAPLVSAKMVKRIKTFSTSNLGSQHLISSLLDQLIQNYKVSTNGDLGRCKPFYFQILLPIFDMLKRAMGIGTPLAPLSDAHARTIALIHESDATDRKANPAGKRSRSPSLSSFLESLKLPRSSSTQNTSANTSNYASGSASGLSSPRSPPQTPNAMQGSSGPTISGSSGGNVKTWRSRKSRKGSMPSRNILFDMSQANAAERQLGDNRLPKLLTSPPRAEERDKERLNRLRNEIPTSVVNFVLTFFVESLEFRSMLRENPAVVERLVELLYCTHRDVGLSYSGNNQSAAGAERSAYRQSRWSDEWNLDSSEKLFSLLVEISIDNMLSTKAFSMRDEMMQIVSPRASAEVVKEMHENLFLRMMEKLRDGNIISDNMLSHKQNARQCSNLVDFCSILAEFSVLNPFRDVSLAALDFVLFMCNKLDPFLYSAKSTGKQRGSSLSSSVASTLSMLFSSLDQLVLLHMLEYIRRLEANSDTELGVGILQKLLDNQKIIFSANNAQPDFFETFAGYLLQILDIYYLEKGRLRRICLDLWKLLLISNVHFVQTVLGGAELDESIDVSGFDLLLEERQDKFLQWYGTERERMKRYFDCNILDKAVKYEQMILEKVGELQRFYFNQIDEKIEKSRRSETEEFHTRRHELEIRLLVEHGKHRKLIKSLKEHRRVTTERYLETLPRDWINIANSLKPIYHLQPADMHEIWLLSSREGDSRRRNIIPETELPILNMEKTHLQRSQEIAAETSASEQHHKFFSRSAAIVTKTPRVRKKESDDEMKKWRFLEREFEMAEGAGHDESEVRSVGDSVEELELERKAQDVAAVAKEYDMAEEKPGEEELDLDEAITFNDLLDRETIEEYNCGIVRGMDKVEGMLILGQKRAYLREGVTMSERGIISIIDPFESKTLTYSGEVRKIGTGFNGSILYINYSEITDVIRCRYLLANCSLEIFLGNGASLFLVFNLQDVEGVYSHLVSKLKDAPWNNVISRFILSLRGDVAQYTNQWKIGEMSNFEYLSVLNTYASRTYSDLQQYPVFPWVLSDYHSEALDLEDEKSYRDLSKPMGALDEERADAFLKRFESWDDRELPPFHYGTHHSSAAIVLYYLLRLEPFATDAVIFQGGRFDHSDRLFSSIEKSYASASSTNMSDVKELIPEFYFLPYFLINMNKLDLGTKQAGEQVDDVVLPRWAKNDPRYFVFRMREALESPIASANLNEWIDLIFGFKQTGKEAIDALNVFYYLTYEGSVKIDEIDDPTQREAIVAQISNFGQTPKKLFPRPHPKKQILVKKFPLFDEPERMTYFEMLKDLPFTCNDIVFSGGADPRPKAYIEKSFAIHHTTSHVLGFRNFDNTIRMSDIENIFKCFFVHDPMHDDAVTSAAFSMDGSLLATGGLDAVINVWSVGSKRHKYNLELKGTLAGHTDSITSLCIHKRWKVVVSGSNDMTMKVWRLDTLTLIRSFEYSGPVQKVDINSETGTIVCCTVNRIFGYDSNCVPLFFHECANGISAIALGPASMYGPNNLLLVTGHHNSEANMWNIDFSQFLSPEHLDPGLPGIGRNDVLDFHECAAKFKVNVFPLILRFRQMCSSSEVVSVVISPCYCKLYVGTGDKKMFVISNAEYMS